MLKLAHGIASWLIGEEIALAETAFVFERPEFAEDYSVLFRRPFVSASPTRMSGFTKHWAAARSRAPTWKMYEFLCGRKSDRVTEPATHH